MNPYSFIIQVTLSEWFVFPTFWYEDVGIFSNNRIGWKEAATATTTEIVTWFSTTHDRNVHQSPATYPALPFLIQSGKKHFEYTLEGQMVQSLWGWTWL